MSLLSLRRKRIWNTKEAKKELAFLLSVGVLTFHFPVLPLFLLAVQFCWALWQIPKVYDAE